MPEAEKKKLYSGYKQSRENMVAWSAAKHNADRTYTAVRRNSKNTTNATPGDTFFCVSISADRRHCTAAALAA